MLTTIQLSDNNRNKLDYIKKKLKFKSRTDVIVMFLESYDIVNSKVDIEKLTKKIAEGFIKKNNFMNLQISVDVKKEQFFVDVNSKLEKMVKDLNASVASIIDTSIINSRKPQSTHDEEGIPPDPTE